MDFSVYTQPVQSQSQELGYFHDGRLPSLTFQEFSTQDNFLQFSDFTQQVKSTWNPAQQHDSSSTTAGITLPSSLDGATSLNNTFNDQLRFQEGFDEDEQPAVTEQLPEYACSYCSLHNPACVVKCLNTGKWFCNGRACGSGACVVLHLVKSKHKEVQLHKESPLGDTILECYATGNRNVFVLGFVPVKSENTVVLLARDTPANHPAVKDLDLDMTQWQPIVEDRQLVSWLVKTPTEAELLLAKRIPQAEINRLEEVWKTKPDAGTSDLAAQEDAGEVQPVALRYDDSHQYSAVFEPLVKLEADYDRAIKESQSRDGITVRWDWGLNQKRVACFLFPRDDNELKLMQGDELKLRHKNVSNRGPWEATGHVVTYQQSEEVCLEMDTNDVPEDCTVGYSVDFLWKGTSFDRMRNALATFRKYSASISGYLYHCILGHEVEPVTLKMPVPKKGVGVPTLPDLNHSQVHAVKSVLSQPLSLIQGPPGTGKTVTSAAIVYHMAQSGTGQVLVAAPSNVAVDQLAQKVDEIGLKVVRLCAKTRETVASPVEHLTLHYQVLNLPTPDGEVFRRLLQLRQAKGGLTASDEKQLKMLRRRLEMAVLEHADVVCCTCVGAGDPRLAQFRFQHVLIDEATQASEPEVLIALVHGAKQVVLVGDHCQLPPVIMCKKAAEAGLCLSLFERLRLLGVKPIRLQVQYRMHPCLTEFPSNTFYEGTLQNGMGVGDRLMPAVDFPWPNSDKPMMFYAQLGSEEISASGTSYLNRTEATNVEKIITRFLQNGVVPSQIGVITPYEGQRAHVVNVLVRNGALRQDLYKDIEVSSVDAFQGREKDIIVLSCVRSNENQSIGFLADPRRLNVALTRARFGLVILGNPRVLSKQPLWNSLLTHFKESGCLVEGPLAALKPCLAQLHKPKKVFDRTAFGVGQGATARFQPPERVGDPLPGKAKEKDRDKESRDQQGAAATGLNAASPKDSIRGAKGSQHVRIAKGPPPANSMGATPNNFMPFAAPSYTIPSASRKGANASFADVSLFSQVSQAGINPFTQAAGSARTQTPTQNSTALTQVLPPLGAFQYPGEFSQVSYGTGTGVPEDWASQGFGQDSFLLSQGFTETQFLDGGSSECGLDFPATQER